MVRGCDKEIRNGNPLWKGKKIKPKNKNEKWDKRKVQDDRKSRKTYTVVRWMRKMGIKLIVLRTRYLKDIYVVLKTNI